jgi:hypothetical protein
VQNNECGLERESKDEVINVVDVVDGGEGKKERKTKAAVASDNCHALRIIIVQ